MNNLYNYIKLYATITEKTPKHKNATTLLKNKIKNVKDLTLKQANELLKKYYK